MGDDVLLYEANDGIATITLNRPGSLNALDEGLSLALQKALGEAGGDQSIRCVVITGAGRAFCSGADLRGLQEASEDMPSIGDVLRERYHPIVLTIVEMEKPVIASVNGIAAGAGASLALTCDFRVAGDQAAFFQAFIRVGLVPDSGANYLLPHLVGYTKAVELAMLGDMVSAEEAHRIGLVTTVVPAAELEAQTRALAERLASGPTRALALTKKALRFGATNDLAATLEYEADLQSQIGITHDAREGVTAFLEKRAPAFEGR